MQIRYFGHTYEQLSNYEFETFEVSGSKLLLQTSGLFGTKIPRQIINQPACILERDGVFHRFELKDFSYYTDDAGRIIISEEQLKNIATIVQQFMKTMR